MSPLMPASGLESAELIGEVHHDVIGYAVFTGPRDV
jgi:hypothetical protein